jgi:hypothetical protein
VDNINTDRQLSDPQDPLPESNWLWRRVFIFALAIAVVYLVYGAVDRLGAVAVIRPDIGIPAFVSIVKLLVLTINFIILCYMVAPSAEQITKLVKTASLLKSGVQIASRAIVRTADRSEETQATVGMPPQPIVPPSSEVASEEDFAPTSKDKSNG